MFAEVIVDISASEVDRVFDYAVQGDISVVRGVRVLVPFGRMTVEGFVVSVKSSTDVPVDKIKNITKVLDNAPLITDEMFALMEHLVEKRHLKKVDVLRLFIPASMRGGRVKELTRQFAYLADDYRGKEISGFIKQSAFAQRDLYYYLSDEKPEGELVSEITKTYSAAALKNMASRGIVIIEDIEIQRVPYKSIGVTQGETVELTAAQRDVISKITKSKCETFLLHGVTGSGKTEVYMRVAENALNLGKTAIVLVPEISLTPQVLAAFRLRFGDRVSLLHSGLSEGERFDEWRKAKMGEAKIVLGARSAIFAPLENVGIIIIDEEHDSSYISDNNPRYTAVDIAQFRKDYNKCNLLLGTATPSIESYYAAKNGQYKLLEMPNRINKRPMPEMQVVNMCNELAHGNSTIFSEALRSELDRCISDGNQAMLFLNRRGYASYVICRRCGHVVKCEHCDVSLVYHRGDEALKCHYCGNRYHMLDVCPECGYDKIRYGYVGTEQVAEQLNKLYPAVNILRMDFDTTRTKDAHAKILGEFRGGNAKVLVGTQMIAKGHDFPNVTLVGILDSDTSLYMSDYRSVERTYQLTTQVSGRAGRDDKVGKVILQTYSPHHYVYKFVQKNDYKGFYDKEANLREVTKYPPFSVIIRVLVTGADEQKVIEVLKNIYMDIDILKKSNEGKFIYLGYMNAPVKKIMDECRKQILMRLYSGNDKIIDEVYNIVEKHKAPKVLSYAEINPIRLS